MPPLVPSWDVDMPPIQRPSSPWPGRAFSRPPPIPENPFLHQAGPVPSPDPQLENPASDFPTVLLGRHHDLGPGELAKSASPCPGKPQEENPAGDPQPPAEPEPLTPKSPKDSPLEKKVLRLSLSHPLAKCDLMRATWPPWRRWGTLPTVPAPLQPTRALGPLPKAGELRQADPGRFAVVMPQVQKPSSFQQVGPDTPQPSTQLTEDPEPSPKPRAWSLLWSCLWLPAKTHRPWPQAHARPSSCCLHPEAACLPHGGPWDEVGPKSWWNKV